MIERHRPTFAGAVPSIWNGVLHYGEGREIDLSSFRLVICGGSAVPKSLMQAFEEKYGVTILQLWGMTETSPLGAIASVPPGVAGEESWTYRVTQWCMAMPCVLNRQRARICVLTRCALRRS